MNQKSAESFRNACADPIEAGGTFAGDPALIEERAHKILTAAPGEAHAIGILVSARRLSGDLSGARDVLDRMLRATPDSDTLWYELGCILRDLGDPEGAAGAFSRAVNLAPDSAGAWRLLGDQLAKLDRGEEARHAYLTCFELSIGTLKSLERAAAAQDVERLVEFLRLKPTDVCIMIMLAKLEERLHRFADAERRLRRILELSPNFAAARYALATVLFKQAQPAETIKQAEIFLQTHPSNPEGLHLKALSLSHLGEYERSLACYERLLKEAPAMASFWVGYGHVLKTVGRVDEAIAAYRKASEHQPSSGDAYWQLADLKTFRFGAAEMKAIRKALAAPAMTEENCALLHFALGKAFEDKKEYKRAFEEYAKGNAIRRGTINYVADATSALVRRSRAVFSKDFFRFRTGVGSLSRDPIFIIGLTRSGSTLVEQILASHSSIEGTAELPVVSALAARLQEMQPCLAYPDGLPILKAEEFRRIGEEYLQSTGVHRKLGRLFVIDKMPHNFQHTGLIHLMLPNAKIVDVRRHPLACGFANFKQHFTRGQPWSYDLMEIGRYYRDYVELMAHFDAVLPGRVHRVIYEELVADPERETRRLLKYCEVPFESDCLRFYENKRPVLTASAEQVRRPIFKESLEQWRNFELWLAPLKVALGDVLAAYPAAPDFDWPGRSQ